MLTRVARWWSGKRLDHVKVVRLQPGDVLVFRSETHLRPQDIDRIHRTAERQFPGHRVVVLDAGISLSVIREAAA